MVVDGILPLLTGANAAVVPLRDEPFSAETRKMNRQFVAQGFVFMGIGEKDLHRRGREHSGTLGGGARDGGHRRRRGM